VLKVNNNDDFIYNIDKIIMNALNEAKKALGPKAYNKIKQIEIIIDTADLTTQEGIVKATRRNFKLSTNICSIKINGGKMLNKSYYIFIFCFHLF